MRQRDRFVQRVDLGRPIDRLPDLSVHRAERLAREAASELSAIDAIDAERLPHQVALTLRVARSGLYIESQSATRYWLARTYNWVPTMFPIAPYGTAHLFRGVRRAFTDFAFLHSGDFARYLALLEDYARLLNQMRDLLVGQALRGIEIPQPALASVREFLHHNAERSCQELAVSPSRLPARSAPADFADSVARGISERIAPAFACLQEAIGADYGARAPETVGIGQFPGGLDTYESLVAEHLSLPGMTVEAVHRIGCDRMIELEAQMAELRASIGHPNRDEFHHYLRTSPPWAAGSEAEIRAHFRQTLSRIEPHLDNLFRFTPAARCRTERLHPTLERAMTAGYYEPPTAREPEGVYYFNSANLCRQSLVGAASLIFHELIPGHHFHLASQAENSLLHPFRRATLFNAFNEGWAEYAATLAGEVGMYADPSERYGRLLKDAYYTCRLVVDTGMNALNWSLERARQYLREHTNLSEQEVRSETLRYSTDIPAQALAYKLGEIKMRELRERARIALGDQFDIREFHEVILGSGGMPLDILDWHVTSWTGAARKSAHA